MPRCRGVGARFRWGSAGVGLLVALASVATAAAQTTHTVTLAGMDFAPENITINVGDTVHWDWLSGFHNVESGVVVNGVGIHDGTFRSGDPTGDPNTTYELVFDQAFLDAHPITGNRYQYYCIIHASGNMVGTVTVQTAGGCFSNTDCDDNNACNGVETCTNNACVAGSALDCDDQRPCTDDSCDASLGCFNIANNSNSCDDGDGCTDDVCAAGECVITAIAGCVACTADADCEDSNPCTTNTCTSSACQSTNNALPCDDGDPCSDSDTCGDGSCAGTTNAACCLSDTDCGTAAECTTVACVGNDCVTSPIQNCKSCTANADCDDGNVCTDDVCSASVCQNRDNSASCDDGDACTENDICSASSCSGTAIAECGDAVDDPDTDDIPDDSGTTDGQDESSSSSSNLCGAAGMISLLGLLLVLGVVKFSRRR